MRSDQAPISVSSTRLLLVEGKDEEKLFEAACKVVPELDAFQRISYRGKDNFVKSLSALTRDSGFPGVKVIAVVRDADDSANSAFDSVANALKRFGLIPPDRHGSWSTGSPKVGIYIMPDGVSPGMLETLCVQSVEAEPAMSCVSAYFECLESVGPLPGNLHKARAHAWLASREKPDRRVGEAAFEDYWLFDSSAFAPLWDFLRQSERA